MTEADLLPIILRSTNILLASVLLVLVLRSYRAMRDVSPRYHLTAMLLLTVGTTTLLGAADALVRSIPPSIALPLTTVTVTFGIALMRAPHHRDD